MAKKWTLISQTVTDHIKVPKTATNVNITRLLNNAKADWASIAKIVNKYNIKNGTHNSVIQRVLDIKNGKITELSQITGKQESNSGTSASSSSSSSSTSAETGANGGTSTVVGGGGLNSTVTKVPIKDGVEAMEFAKTEWNKIRRTSGHTLELQVFGNNLWQVGEWCKVYIPSLNEYVDMYISKIDNSNDSGSEWLTSITLMDYAPQLSSVDEADLKSAETGGEAGADGEAGDGSGNAPSKWTEIASILQTYYEKPSGGWDNLIRSILKAKVYDPDIRNLITPLAKKKGQELKSYVDVGHELCKVMEIVY